VSLAYGRQGDLSDLATLLPNRSFLVCRGDSFVYVAPGHEPMTNGKASGSILAVFPDGAVVCNPKKPLSVRGAPGSLAWVTVGREFGSFPTQLSETRFPERVAFIRVDDSIVWVGRGSDVATPSSAAPLHLFMFNVARGQARRVGNGESPIEVIVGFDGRSVFDGVKVVNIETGIVTETSASYKKFHDLFYLNCRTEGENVIAFLDGMVFLARETDEAYELVGVPFQIEPPPQEARKAFPSAKRLDEKPFSLDDLKTLLVRNVTYRLEKSKLSRIPKAKRDGFNLRELFFSHDIVMRVWDGTTWLVLPIPKSSGM
jgi:hypothetical protein